MGLHAIGRAPTDEAPREPHPEDFHPHPGPQTEFLSLTVDEVLYGGAAGPGKSCSLVIDAIRYVGVGYGANYHAILFRRTFPELEKSLILESLKWYPRLGGVYNEQKKRWTFPAGELVDFSHMVHERDMLDHDGAEYQFVGFDEVTSFTEAQYLYLTGSRCRSAHGVPCRVRAATNPGGIGHAWVFARWGAWLDPNAEIQAQPGETLYFLRDDAGESIVPKGTRLARSRTFIPGRLEDNPSLYNDGRYEAGLQTLSPVERRRKRHGDWLVQPDTYLFHDVRYFDVSPGRYRVGIGIDLAYSEKSRADWSCAVVLAECEGLYYVLDVRREQCEVAAFATILRELKATYPGARFHWFCSTTEKGLGDYLRSEGLPLTSQVAPADKLTRAQPLSAAWNDGEVLVKRVAPWVQKYVEEMSAFTGLAGGRDDQVDGTVSAYHLIAKPKHLGKSTAKGVRSQFGATGNPFAPSKPIRW